MQYQKRRPKRSLRCFSLSELLIVVAILLILVSLLSPSLNRLFDQTISMRCQMDFREIGLAVYEFAENNDDHCVGYGYKLGASNGSVKWTYILEESVLKKSDNYHKKGITIYTQSSSTKLGCPRVTPEGYKRIIGLNRRMVSGPEVDDDTLWPLNRRSVTSTYNLGQPFYSISRPDRLALISDMDYQNVDTFNGGTTSVPRLTSSTYYYNKVTDISFRHNIDYTLASQIFADLHGELITADKDYFTSDRYVP